MTSTCNFFKTNRSFEQSIFNTFVLFSLFLPFLSFFFLIFFLSFSSLSFLSFLSSFSFFPLRRWLFSVVPKLPFVVRHIRHCLIVVQFIEHGSLPPTIWRFHSLSLISFPREKNSSNFSPTSRSQTIRLTSISGSILSQHSPNNNKI